MPGVSLETVQTLDLAPGLGIEVATRMDTYLANKAYIAQLEAENDRLKTEIRETLAEAGEAAALDAGVAIGQHGRLKMVYPVRNPIDTKSLLRQGVTLDQIKAASPDRPGAPYLLITAPGKERSGT